MFVTVETVNLWGTRINVKFIRVTRSCAGVGFYSERFG